MDDQTDSVRRLSEWERPDLVALADEYGTPLYVMDLDRVRANYRRLSRAFKDVSVKYAAKANAGGHVLSTVVEAGGPIECGSPGEVDRALAAGGDPGRTQYTAVNPPAAALDRACAVAKDDPGFVVTAGAADTVDRLADRDFAGGVLVRVNPGVGAGHHEKVVTGTNPKFGVPAARLDAVLERTVAAGLDLRGIHAHVGSGMLGDDRDAYERFCRRMRSFVRDAPVVVETVDLGGGFGVPYRADDPPLDVGAIAETVRDTFSDLDVDLVVEPGRYVVADAGVLLGRVNTVKATPDRVVIGTDVGMTTLLRPALYDAYHPLRVVVDGGAELATRPEARCLVGGPICESSDVLADDRHLPRPERGDLLAVGNAGAYGYEMALQFHSQPRPAAVAIEDDEVRLVRRREDVTDVTATEVGAQAYDSPQGDHPSDRSTD